MCGRNHCIIQLHLHCQFPLSPKCSKALHGSEFQYKSTYSSAKFVFINPNFFIRSDTRLFCLHATLINEAQGLVISRCSCNYFVNHLIRKGSWQQRDEGHKQLKKKLWNYYEKINPHPVTGITSTFTFIPVVLITPSKVDFWLFICIVDPNTYVPINVQCLKRCSPNGDLLI